MVLTWFRFHTKPIVCLFIAESIFHLRRTNPIISQTLLATVSQCALTSENIKSALNIPNYSEGDIQIHEFQHRWNRSISKLMWTNKSVGVIVFKVDII